MIIFYRSSPFHETPVKNQNPSKMVSSSDESDKGLLLKGGEFQNKVFQHKQRLILATVETNGVGLLERQQQFYHQNLLSESLSISGALLASQTVHSRM